MKILTDKNGWQFAVVSEDSQAAVWAWEQRRLDYDRSVEDVVRRIKVGDTVLDVGANIGAYSVRMAQAAGNEGKIYAIEANPVAFECLEYNCRNLTNAIVIHAAAAAANDSQAYMIQEANVGASHISDSSPDYACQTMTIDSLELVKCNLIKMDIEGFEPLAILGAMKTIRRCRPIIFIELNDGVLARYGFNKDSILNPLLALDYKLEFLESKHSLDYPQLDVFLMP